MKRLFYGYVIAQTLLMIIPMMQMPTLQTAALAWRDNSNLLNPDLI